MGPGHGKPPHSCFLTFWSALLSTTLPHPQSGTGKIQSFLDSGLQLSHLQRGGLPRFGAWDTSCYLEGSLEEEVWRIEAKMSLVPRMKLCFAGTFL